MMWREKKRLKIGEETKKQKKKMYRQLKSESLDEDGGKREEIIT